VNISRLSILRVFLIFVLCAGGGILLFGDIPPVVLSWETASEVGAAGFNVYRASVAEDDFVCVNSALIPAQGDEVVGATYRFADDAVVVGRRYVYRIEEVEWDGQRNVYAETVTVRAGLPRLWVKVEGGILILLAVGLLWRGRRRIRETKCA
jgi:hypothetical protein